MHGLIHLVFKEFVVAKFGSQTWSKVLRKCSCDDEDSVIEMRQYEDSLTLQIIGAGIEVTGVSFDGGVELFGRFFVGYLAQQGWVAMLTSMGSNFREFVQNLNEMHHILERDFRSSIFPFFSTSEDESGNLLLSYTSRRFLPSLVRGILGELAAVLFKVKAEFVELSTDKISRVTWSVKFSQLAVAGELEETPKPQRCFGWFQLHEALTSMCRGLPGVEALTCCSANTAEVEAITEVVAVSLTLPQTAMKREEDRDVESEASPQRSRSFLQSPMHRSSPGEEVQAGNALTSVTMIRHQYGIEPTRHLADWLSVLDLDHRLELAEALIRAVPASKVSCQWYELGGLAITQTSFWDPQLRLSDFYSWSDCWRHEGEERSATSTSTSEGPFHFVSHSWWPPQDWHQIMGERCFYADIKAAELCIAAKDLCAEYLHDASRWEEARFWIDKCCIRQGDQEFMSLSIQLIEEFLQLCDGMVVLFSWSYLTRLWCVYEWACFLVFHEPENLVICIDSFYRDSTEDKFLDAVRSFSVDGCQCTDPSDWKILEKKIDEYYGCRENFERFLRVSVIAITARSLAARGARSKLGLTKWVKLAQDLGFEELAKALSVADPSAWRKAALDGEVKMIAQDFQTAIKAQNDIWFAENVAPILAAERRRAVQQKVYQKMQVHRRTVQRALTEHSLKRRLTIGPRLSDSVRSMKSHASVAAEHSPA
mmetsp:Transcript_28236/g.50959  ORF Transcript_28236/g.50959 Transcript_28236/m.50959 type:complete len:709 (-) Transcript_28236:310-2436(-)